MEALPSRRSYRAGIQIVFGLGVLLLLTAAAPVVALQIRDGGAAWFNLVWLAIIGWFWFNALFLIVYRIDVDGESVELRCLARRWRTRMTSISSIRGRTGGASIRFEGGRAEVWGTIDGFRDFVARVEAANPQVEIRGI